METGVFTDVYRAKFAELGAGVLGASNVDAALSKLSYFKVGEMGHTGVSPDVPDPTLSDIQASTDISAGAGGVGSRFFQKTFGVGDVSYVAGVLTVVCHVDGAEGNAQGADADPTYYELGIFDEHDDMIAYLTYTGQEKPVGEPLMHVVRVRYDR